MTFSVCCHPEILLPWERDVTTSPLYRHDVHICGKKHSSTLCYVHIWCSSISASVLAQNSVAVTVNIFASLTLPGILKPERSREL